MKPAPCLFPEAPARFIKSEPRPSFPRFRRKSGVSLMMLWADAPEQVFTDRIAYADRLYSAFPALIADLEDAHALLLKLRDLIPNAPEELKALPLWPPIRPEGGVSPDLSPSDRMDAAHVWLSVEPRNKAIPERTWMMEIAIRLMRDFHLRPDDAMGLMPLAALKHASGPWNHRDLCGLVRAASLHLRFHGPALDERGEVPCES